MSVLVGIRSEAPEQASVHLVQPLGIAEPGKFQSVEDFSDGHRALIIAACLPDNTGGVVWRTFDKDTVLPDDDIRSLSNNLTAPKNVLATLTMQRLERRVTTATAAGILVVEHHILRYPQFSTP